MSLAKYKTRDLLKASGKKIIDYFFPLSDIEKDVTHIATPVDTLLYPLVNASQTESI